MASIVGIAMRPWIIIPSVAFLVSLLSFLIDPQEDLRWAKRLNLPRWLAIIEPVIPAIWTIIFICGAASAVLVWSPIGTYATQELIDFNSGDT